MERLTELSTELRKIEQRKVGVGADAVSGAPKRRLQRIGVQDAHHPHHDACSALFAALYTELAPSEAELHETQRGPRGCRYYGLYRVRVGCRCVEVSRLVCVGERVCW